MLVGSAPGRRPAFANDVMATATVLQAPSPDHAKTGRKNEIRMHVVLLLATNAIEGVQGTSFSPGLTFRKMSNFGCSTLAYNSLVHTQSFDAFPPRRSLVQTPSRNGAEMAHCFSPRTANISIDRGRT